jgi:hypothetical protein
MMGEPDELAKVRSLAAVMAGFLVRLREGDIDFVDAMDEQDDLIDKARALKLIPGPKEQR